MRAFLHRNEWKLLLVALTLTAAVEAQGQVEPGRFCLYADPTGTDCAITDDTPGLLQVYVVHTATSGAAAGQFAAPRPSCMVGATWVGEASPFPVTIGDSQTSFVVGYGSCQSAPVHVLTINYFTNGQTLADCAYPVVAGTGTGIFAVNCPGTPVPDVGVPALGSVTYLNSNLPCECDEPLPVPQLQVTPSQLDFGFATTELDLQISDAASQGNLAWIVWVDEPWLYVSIPQAQVESGGGDANVTIGVDRDDLPSGTYNATVMVASNGGMQDIPVTVQGAGSGSPVLDVFPGLVRIPADRSSASVYVRNLGGGVLAWTVLESIPWLSVVPQGGVNNETVGLFVDRTGLAEGTHNGTMEFSSNGGSEVVSVSMDVVLAPILVVDPRALTVTTLEPEEQFTIENVGIGTLTWTASADEPWLVFDSPTAGSGDATVDIHVDLATAPPNDASALITVSSNGGTRTIDVNYRAIEMTTPGTLGVYADAAGMSCSILDDTPGLKTLYVVHTETTGSAGVGFKAVQPGCFQATYLSDQPTQPVINGNSQTGVEVGYGPCESGPIAALAINYFAEGQTPACCLYFVSPRPGLATIESFGCQFELRAADLSVAVINGDSSCPCGRVTLATEESTWGGIKALYSPAE